MFGIDVSVYLTMYKVDMHVGAIRQLSLKLVEYISVHTRKPYNNFHLFYLDQVRI